VAAKEPSWMIFRELLFVGAQGSVGRWSLNVWKEKTHITVCKLQETQLEVRDDSLRLMPTVVVTATKDDENDDLMDLTDSPE
jgi:hypothetical protein